MLTRWACTLEGVTPRPRLSFHRVLLLTLSYLKQPLRKTLQCLLALTPLSVLLLGLEGILCMTRPDLVLYTTDPEYA